MLAKISARIVRSTGLILALVAALAVLAALQLFDPKTGQLLLEIDPSANRLIAEDEPAKQFYDKTRRIFGSDETLIITLSSGDVFTLDTLERIDRMTRQISELESVHHVVSLTNALDIRSTADGLDIAPFIDNIAGKPGEIASIRARVLANPIYRGSLVSVNGDTTALVVFFHDIYDREFIRHGIHDRIVAIVEQEKGDNEIWYTGAPHFKVSLIKILLHELIWTPPIIAAVLAIILAISFRTLSGIAVPLITISAGVIMTLGTIVALG
ncbi:MAG: MMPL family transporter, partial [Gammaproteobacteria bacterium]